MNQFDAEFLSRLIKKDPIAFSEFYEKTIDIFYRFVKSTYGLPDSDIEDIISDFYTKIRSNLSNIKLEYRFESFLRTVLRNTAKDFLSSRKTYNFSELEQIDDEGSVVSFTDNLVGDEGDYISLLQNDYEYSQIQDALSKLDGVTQQIIFLKYIQGFSFDEISSDLCITNDNVRQKLSRGLKKLKSILDS